MLLLWVSSFFPSKKIIICYGCIKINSVVKKQRKSTRCSSYTKLLWEQRTRRTKVNCFWILRVICSWIPPIIIFALLISTYIIINIISCLSRSWKWPRIYRTPYIKAYPIIIGWSEICIYLKIRWPLSIFLSVNSIIVTSFSVAVNSNTA